MGIEGWTVNLYWNGQVIASTSSLSDGSFIFQDLGNTTYQGRPIFDVTGAAKQRLRPHDLLEKFEELRRSDQLDETAARLLREAYV